MRLLIILLATALCGSAEEAARNSRLRFPSEIPQQVELGPQLFESETQVLPMVIHGNAAVNTPHMIYAKQAPSTINPFIQIGHKPYSEGLVLPYYQPPERPQAEFHQTMPPPLRATPYGPPKAVTTNLQGNRQSTIQLHQAGIPHRNQERQPERHRFGSHRVPMINAQQSKQKPQSQYPPKQHRPSSQYHKDIQHQQPDTLFKYSILSNHSPQPKIPHTEKFEQDFFKSHKQPTYIKKRPAIHKKQPFHHDDSSDFPEDSAEFDQGIPDWQIKGNFYDTPEEHDSFFYKKNKNKNPHTGLSSTNKHNFNSEFSFSHDFSDFPSFQSGKNNKRFPHFKPDSNNKRGGAVKAVYEPSQEHINQDYDFKKYFPKPKNQRDRTKSEDFLSHDNFSGEKFYSDYDFPENFHSQQEDEPINSNFGSEWIPINAPEGVPAKSYDIPPPDLSRGGFKDRNIIRREYPHEREDSNLVYGVQKPSNSEEVVSAVVRVKQ